MEHSHVARPDIQQLLDDENTDDLLQRVSLDEIAAAWRCYNERASAGEYVDYDDPDWWAVELWLSGGIAFGQRAIARAGLLALVREVPGDLLNYVGAGPLETFISSNEHDVRWLENTAREDPRFRAALSSVHLDTEESWVRDRLMAVIGDPDDQGS